MATYIKINNVKYPAVITGKLHDNDWDNRESKAITVEMPYEEAMNLFVDEAEWYIVQDIEERVEQIDENGEVTFTTVIKDEYYDNSDYSIAGDIINHRNGKITAKMGKPTAEELLAMFEEAMIL